MSFKEMIVFSLFSLAVIKPWPKQAGRRKDFLSSYTLQTMTEGSQGRTSRQNLKQRPWKSTACWLVLCCLLSQLLSTTPMATCLPRDSPSHSGLGLPTSFTNQENAPPPCTGQSDGGNSSIDIPLFPGDSRLCQIDKNKQTNKHTN